MPDQLATVVPLRPDQPGAGNSTVERVRRRAADWASAAPERRTRNGHHGDCPYPTTDPQWCTICASIRKGATT